MTDLPLWFQIVTGLCAASLFVRKLLPAFVLDGRHRAARCWKRLVVKQDLSPHHPSLADLTHLYAAELASCEDLLKAWKSRARGG